MPAQLLLCAALDHLHRLHQAGACPSLFTMHAQHYTATTPNHRQHLLPIQQPAHVQLNASKGQEGIKEVRQAFSYTLDRMGAHAQSGPLWQDYLAFLKGPQPGSPEYMAMYSGPSVSAGQEDSHRAAVLRCAQVPGCGLSPCKAGRWACQRGSS